jgi:hypothetical protein
MALDGRQRRSAAIPQEVSHAQAMRFCRQRRFVTSQEIGEGAIPGETLEIEDALFQRGV